MGHISQGFQTAGLPNPGQWRLSWLPATHIRLTDGTQKGNKFALSADIHMTKRLCAEMHLTFNLATVVALLL